MGEHSSGSALILGVSVVGMLLLASLPIAIDNIYVPHSQESFEVIEIPMGDRVWVSLDGTGEVKPPKFSVVSVSNSEIVFDLKFSGFFSKTVNQGTNVYQSLAFQGCKFTDGLGAPQIPTFVRGFALPYNTSVQIQILQSNFSILDGYNVYPTQELTYESYEVQFPFVVNDSIYGQNMFFPSQPAIHTYCGDMRTVEIGHLVLFPLRYNPSSQLLRGYTHIKGRIQFSGGSGTYYHPEKRSPFFEPFYKNILINYAVLEGKEFSLQSSKMPRSPDYDYLIICEDAFYSNILPLVQWRKQNGLKVKIVNISDIAGGSPNSTDIRLFVSDEYWNHNIDFLLLVGDSEHVPVAYRTEHPYHHNQTSTYNDTCVATDYAYICFHIPPNIFDMYPDVHGGRISINTPDELDIVINKILTYEQNPPTSPDWYAEVLLAAQDEGGTPFVADSDEIGDYLTNNESKTCTKIYWDHTTHNGTGQDCINTINNGVFLVNHRDHGNSGNHPPGFATSGWSHPELTNNNWVDFTNEFMLPVIFNVNCESGWFDGETDENQLGGNIFAGHNSESMPEDFLRHKNGTVGMVAATRISWRQYNKHFNRGLIDAIWPEFYSLYPTANDTNPWGSNPVPIYHMGAVLNYAKYYLLDEYGPAIFGGNIVGMAEQTLDMYHWHGDPAMQIWTELPEDLTVGLGSWPYYFTDGIDHWFSDHIKMQVNDTSNLPIEDANIAIVGNISNLFLYDQTDNSGYKHLTIPATPDGPAMLTISKHNYLPHIQKIITDQSPPISQNVHYGKPNYTFLGQKWITSNTDVIINATDQGNPPSGIRAIHYSFNHEDWQNQDPPAVINFPNEGQWTLWYYAQDNVNNIEAEHTIQVKVDNSPPLTTVETHQSPIDPDKRLLYINTTDQPAWGAGTESIHYRIVNISGDTGWLTSTTDLVLTHPQHQLQFIQYYAIDHLENQETMNSGFLSSSHILINKHTSSPIIKQLIFHIPLTT
jgi:hypothetical protein